MRTMDVLMGVGALAVLAMAGVLVHRARVGSRADQATDPAAQFASCQAIRDTRKQVMCQVGIARKAGQAHCIDGRLYHVYRDAEGRRHSDPWPPDLHCQADDVQPTPPGRAGGG